MYAMSPLIAVAILLSAPALHGAGAERPVIACRAPVYSFPESDDSQTVENTFLIWNDGTVPLEITKIRGCCGASTELATNSVPPGTNTALKVKLSLKGRGGEQQKSVYVGSNDPRQPYYQLRFVGKVSPRVRVEPPAVDFGRVPQDAAVETNVTLTCLTNCAFRITNLTVSAKVFEAAYETAPGGWSHRVTIRTVLPFPPGIVQGQVSLFTDNGKCGRIDIPVMATVSNDLVVVPSEISVPAGDSPVPVTRYVAIRSRTGREFRILKVATPDPDIQAKWEPLTGGGYRCELANILPSPGLDGERVTIMTDHPEAGEVTVPMRVGAAQPGQP